jgi:hypothetical protein
MWLQGCGRFLESCYFLVKSKNPVSKYGDMHVFLLRMWRTKRHLKKSCKCEISLHFFFFCGIVAYVLSYFMQFATSMESKTLDAMPWEERDWWWIPTGVFRWWIQNNSWEAARDSTIDALHDNLLMNNTFLCVEHPSRYSFPGSILQGNKLNLHGTRKLEEDRTESCFSFPVVCASSYQSIN